MCAPSLRPAELDDAALATIRALEQRLGCAVVAYARETPYAPLTADALAAVQQAETELGVRLLAFAEQPR